MADEDVKVIDTEFQANTHQNTPSDDDLDAAVANDAARQLSGEATVEESVKESDKVETKVDDEEPEREDEETHKRIARLAGEARIAKREAKALQEEINRLKGLAPKLEPDAELEKVIQERAQQLSAQQAYNDGCNKIFEDGVKLYPDFRDVVTTINKEIGNMPVALVEAAMEIGDPHKIIHYLGKNLDEAERIYSLSPHKMGAALAKLATKANAPVKQLSKAPAPIKPISGSAKNNKTPENMSMDEFVKWQDKVDRERRYN